MDITKPTPIQAWLMAIRRRTLPIPLIQIITGLAFVYAVQGSIDWWLALCTLLVGICVTIEVNLFNDALDKDILDRHGHLKVIPAGFLTQKQVFMAGLLFAALVIFFGIPLILKGGWMMTLVIVLSALLGYCYTGGPLPICYLGFSELFVLFFYGFVCIGSTFYIQTGFLDSSTFLVATQMGFFAILPAALNNFRDQKDDAQVNKRTLVVRLGKTFGRLEITLLALLPFLLGILWLDFGYQIAAVLPMVIFPLAYLLVYLVWKTEPSSMFNQYFILCVAIHFAFGLFLSIGLNL